MTSELAVTGQQKNQRALVAILVLLAVACAGVFGLRSRACEAPSASVAGSSPSAAPHCELRSIDFGTVRAGEAAKARFKFTNDTDLFINTAAVQTSCPCLRVEFDKRGIAPRETAEGTVGLDLADETEFTGALSPEIRFFDDQGSQRFVLVVNAIVASSGRRALQQ